MKQHKQRSHEMARLQMIWNVVMNDAGKIISRKRVKGPAKTKPLHGKHNRLPYIADLRNAILKSRGEKVGRKGAWKQAS